MRNFSFTYDHRGPQEITCRLGTFCRAATGCGGVGGVCVGFVAQAMLGAVFSSCLIQSIFTKDAAFMRKLFFGFVLLLAATVAASAAPGGAVRCGRLLDVRTGQLLSDQVVTFDADGLIV